MQSPSPAIGHEDFLRFNRLLASLLESGLPLGEALRAGAQRAAEPQTQEEFQGLARDIESGIPLSQALESRQESLPQAYLSLVRAGLDSGDLPGSLRLFVAMQERLSESAAEATGLMVHPTVLFSLSFLFSFSSAFFILPAFREFTDGYTAGQASQAPLWLATAFFALFALASAAISLGLWRFVLGTPSAKNIWSLPQSWIAGLPILKGMGLRFQGALFLRQMSAQLKAGLSLNRALRACALGFEAQGPCLDMEKAAKALEEGKAAPEALEALGFLPGFARAALRGAKEGREAEHLDLVASSLERDLRYYSQWGLTLLESGMSLLLGCLIGTAAIVLWNTYLSLFSLTVS